MSARDAEAGITLVEMLVALSLFALVGLASFALLDTVIRTRDRTEGRLDDVAALDRALILFGRDLGQSDPGSQALAEGELTFGLAGAGGPPAMVYAVEGGALERRTVQISQRLVEGVASAQFQVLDRAGTWHDAWPPKQEGEALPLTGVELRLVMANDAGGPSTVRRLVELPLGVPVETSARGYVAPPASP